jgi:hypothetical protein
MPKALDLAKFLSDPEHQESRTFINGVIDARVKELAVKAREERENDDDDDDNGLENLFDVLFGGKQRRPRRDTE